MRVILNPAAGGGADVASVEEWAAERPAVELRETRSAGDAERWASEAARAGVSRVVAAGGDGTIGEVARGLLRDRYRRDAEGAGDLSDGPVLGILPIGTGNDLARSLDIPFRIDRALELVGAGCPRPMDVVEMTGGGQGVRFFFNALTGGFAGRIHDSLDPDVKARWGPLSYLRSGIEAWGDRRRYAVTLEVDGKPAEYEALNVVVANGTYAGRGVPVAPGADPFDGVLDVVVILDAPALELSGAAARILAGEEVDHEAIVRLRGRQVQLEVRDPFPVSIDGEPEEVRSVTLRIRPGQLPVVVGC